MYEQQKFCYTSDIHGKQLYNKYINKILYLYIPFSKIEMRDIVKNYVHS